jgi:hypothetical protein
MDKYTKMKTELDKQKQYGAQLSNNLRQAQRKKSRTMSSYRTIGNSTSSNFYNASSLYRVTHFSHYFPRSKVKKKVKVEIDDNNNVKKLKEDFYSINFNKIRGLEVFPGRIVIKEINKNVKQNNLKTSSYNRFINLCSKNIENNKKDDYLTFNEIMSDIQIISNKHKADEQIPEQMLQIQDEVYDDAERTRTVLKDKNPNDNLQFGLFKKKKNLMKINTSY